jgi:large subunit ribosomal protein L4
MALEVSIYNQEGKEAGKVALPAEVFSLPWNADLVHQVVVSMQSNARTSIAHTKDRSDVSGGGKKPWRQKGTGRARHGSTRSPIWRGGGVTFGPRNEKDFSKKVNRKMKTKALYTILSRKLKDNEIIFVQDFSFSEPKTAQAKQILRALSLVPGGEQLARKRKNAALIALSGPDSNAQKSFQNFGNVSIDTIRNINPLVVLTYKYLIVADPTKSIKWLADKSRTGAAA